MTIQEQLLLSLNYYDLHLLKSAEGRRAALALAGREDVWLIMVCRSPIPAWLMPFYVRDGFLVITEDDLCLGEKEIAAYMETYGIELTEEELPCGGVFCDKTTIIGNKI